MDKPAGLTITLSTCCRGRSEHVKQTLLKNMEDNQQDFVRFLLVNYNSDDDLDDWARDNLSRYITAGRVIYIHEKTAERFKHAHARNVAVRACQTDVTCNVDADNFTGPGFGRWVLRQYRKNAGTPMFTAYGPERGAPCGDLFGRISFQVRDLIALGGYNEDLNQWGVEDYDLSKRAERAGFKRVSYPEMYDTEPLKHALDSRVRGTSFDSPFSSLQSSENLHLGKYSIDQMPNAKGRWGRASVEVNWERTVELPLSAEEKLF